MQRCADNPITSSNIITEFASWNSMSKNVYFQLFSNKPT
ncbi:hypothetical protein LT85_2806 [Collimonas arenae]|uniref:Uncharacterized protein n=1 Tax=Collimonas arenae TaxID=279058 RepID=A0A0A1FE78_9BURK|nr:hypothetical protein LT85_2806 [Collimonas arenae]